MGCSGSDLTPCNVCSDAYSSQKPINIKKLQESIARCTAPGTIDDAPEPLGFTALSLAVLNKTPQAEAVQMLLNAGANVFTSKRGFHSSALGLALRYDSAVVLEVMLLSLKEEGWRQLLIGVMSPPEITVAGIGVAGGVWVWVRGQRAKTEIDVLGIGSGKEATVICEDGTKMKVPTTEIQALPCVPKESRAVLIKVAEAANCGPEILAPLRLLEEGDYGTMPRGWGTLASGGMALTLGAGVGGMADMALAPAAAGAMVLGM